MLSYTSDVLSEAMTVIGPVSTNLHVRSEDESLLIRIAVMPTANIFKRGHRIRLQVSRGAYPMIARNTGTSEPLKHATHLRVADHKVFHDPEHASTVMLQVSNS